jgi:hypothetical protein
MARQNLLRHRLMRSLRTLRCQKTTEHYRIRKVAETTFSIELLVGPVHAFASPGLSRKRNSRSLDFEAVIGIGLYIFRYKIPKHWGCAV